MQSREEREALTSRFFHGYMGIIASSGNYMKNTKKVTKKQPIHHRIKRHAKMAVVPHKANEFRPHLVRWYGIVAMLVIACIAVGSSQVNQGSILGVEANITATDLVNDTNAERSKQGEPALRYNEQLSSAAFLKAQDMFKKQYWAHTAPDGTTPWQWFGEAGYNYSYAGENLAKNFTTTSATVAAWMASQHHRENILNKNYTDVGFAVMDGKLDGKPTTLIVALYGSPASAVAGATSTVSAPGDISVMARIGMALQTMSPAALGSLMLLIAGALVALLAHAYRKQLPQPLRKSWKYHHGLYKAVGLTSFAIVLAALYSGGQI